MQSTYNKVMLVYSLALWILFMMHSTFLMEKGISVTFLLYRTWHRFLGRGDGDVFHSDV